MSNFVSVNILDLAEVLGEDKVKSILSDFTCAKNSEIENFVREKALEFANKKMSVTYLECEDKDKLLSFYSSPQNGFKKFGERYSERESVKYIRLFRFV